MRTLVQKLRAGEQFLSRGNVSTKENEKKATHKILGCFFTCRADHLLFLPIDPQQHLLHGEAGILWGRRQNAP